MAGCVVMRPIDRLACTQSGPSFIAFILMRLQSSSWLIGVLSSSLRVIHLELPSPDTAIPTLIYLHTGQLPNDCSTPDTILGLLQNGHYLLSDRLVHDCLTQPVDIEAQSGWGPRHGLDSTRGLQRHLGACRCAKVMHGPVSGFVDGAHGPSLAKESADPGC